MINSSTARLASRRQITLISSCIAGGFCLALALSPAVAGTDGTHNVRVRPGNALSLQASARPNNESAAVVEGHSIAGLAQGFWTWLMSIPLKVGIGDDSGGINCGINQSGAVWFMAAPLGGVKSVYCTVPAGKAIFAPAVTVINDYPCPDPSFEPASGQSLEDFLTQGVTPIVDPFAATVLFDGKSLRVRRVTAGLQSFIGAKDIASVDPCVTGSPQLAVVDGLYALIQSPSPGQHTLEVISFSPYIGNTDNTFHLTIK